MSNNKRQKQHLFLTVFVGAAAIASAFIVMASSNSSNSYAQQMNQMDQMRNQTQIRNSLTHANVTTPTTMPSNMTTTTALPSAALETAPTQGYNSPDGHLTAIRHIFDEPSLRVHHFCKPNDKIVLICQLYDSGSSNATLIGIEYIITKAQYDSLPDREKPNWHYHAIEFATNRADPMFPELNATQAAAVQGKLIETYGKVIIAWDPKDNLPAFPPQVEQVQHPFLTNATIVPDMHGGSPAQGPFNQTLKY